MEPLFTKAKGPYTRDLSGKGYFDLRKFTNITGYADPSITRDYKDAISSIWDLDLPSIYHKRLEKILLNGSNGDFTICVFKGIEHFYLKIAALSGGIRTQGLREKEYFLSKQITSSEKGAVSHDMTELFLTKAEYTPIKSSINIMNYYYFPYAEIDYNKYVGEIIVLPGIISGNSEVVFVLIKKSFKEYIESSDELSTLRASEALLTLKYFARIKKYSHKKCFPIKSESFISNERIFSYNNLTKENVELLYAEYFEKGIILNKYPPYYSYMPLILDDNQVKKIKRIFL